MVSKLHRLSRRSKHGSLPHGRKPASPARRAAPWGRASAWGMGAALAALLPLTGMGIGLVSAGSQFWRPADLWTGGSPPVPGAFAAAVATGDFDGDGWLDLAIGDRFADVGAIQDAGVVTVIYGSATGLVTAGNQLWHQDVGSVPDTAEAFDYFGWALAVGDFDDDGFDDLAIGTAGENDGATSNSGSVQVLYGSATGLTDSGSQNWDQNVADVPDSNEASDYFGWAVTSGDFDGDGYDDLAIGVAGETLSLSGEGQVIALYGSATGLFASVASSQTFAQGAGGIAGNAEPSDFFGKVLSSGDYDADGYDDLAVGVPDENVFLMSGANEGVVQVILGSITGLTSTGNQSFNQGDVGGTQTIETNDEFGSALASGDFDGDGRDELAIGAPGEDFDEGRVHVLEKTGASWNTHLGRLDQDVAGMLGTGAAGERFGAALSAGDFDGDGWEDLAIGVPEEDVLSTDSGSVHVVYGTASGLGTADNEYWNQNDAQINDTPEGGDLFGWALAAGDFDGDGTDDLAIGVPFELEGATPAGAANVLYGYGLCPNGVVQAGEECDDDNLVDEDGCSSVCVAEFCGDGVIQPGLGETCDDSNSSSEDGCSSLCVDEFCGDSVTQPGLGESCDDGNTISEDGCSDICIAEFCGDGVIQPGLGESCDDSNSAGGDGCSAACWPELGGADLFGTSMGGSVSITVNGVLITITTVPGQTAAEILAALAAAILADPTLSGLGVQVAVIGDRLYTSFPATGYTLLDLGLSETASAAVTTAYTDDTAFSAALAGAATTENFDALLDDDPVGTLGDLTFTTAAPVELPLATEAFESASAPVSLGIDNLDKALLDGDPLEIALAQPADAIALRIVTSDPALLDEMILVTPVGAAFNAALVESTAGDGGHIYFVGLVSDTPFSNAVLGFEEDAATNFVYTVDDVQVRFVPEPGFLLSLGSGIAFLALAQRRRERASRGAQGRSR